MLNLYHQIEPNFVNNEQIGVTYSTFIQHDDIEHQIKTIQSLIDKDVTLKYSQKEERFYHNSIINKLKHKLNEIAYYSDIELDTRRLITVNEDCISLVQVLFRDEINVVAHFRSSHYDKILLTDLLMLLKIPGEIISHLEEFYWIKPEFKYLNPEKIKQKDVKITVTFGSLHK